VLQFVAVCCSVLQCVAVCCSVLQCVAVCCSVLQCIAVLLCRDHSRHKTCGAVQVDLCCSMLQYSATSGSVLQRVAAFEALQYTATYYNTLLLRDHCKVCDAA